MLHSLPAVLNELETCLIQGRDPLPVVNSIKWSEVIDWPRDLESAQRIKRQVTGITAMIQGLNAPLNAALAALSDNGSYGATGAVPGPKRVSFRLSEHI